METTALVRIIVQEVLKQVALQEKRGVCVRVLSCRSSELAARITPLVQAWYGDGVELVFTGEACGSREVRARILPVLTCSDMADLAAGRAGTPAMQEVLDCLLSGAGVEVLDFEYRRYEQSAPSALFALYQGYEKTLARFGLVAFRVKKPETVKNHGHLITARTLEEAGRDNARTLMVAESAKVTPLALETADRLGIRIVREP